MLHYHYERARRGLRRRRCARRWTRGEIGDIDPEVTAWALMASGELIGMRWILWGDGDGARSTSSGARAHHPLRRWSGAVTRVSLAATAAYLPERWMTAAEVAERERHPRAGDRREVRPARQAHRRGGRARQRPLGAARPRRCSPRPGVDPESIDVVMYFGSMWKDYARLAGGAVDRASHRRDERVRGRVRQRVVRHAGRAAHRARHAASRRTSCARSWSSPRAASRISSTTATSARGSCSTSATARSPGCSSRTAAATSCSAATASPTARSRSR